MQIMEGSKDEGSTGTSSECRISGSETVSESEESKKSILWQGVLEWYGFRGDKGHLGDEDSRDLPCTLHSEATETESGDSTSTKTSFDDRMYLHLIPKARLKKLDLGQLQQTKSFKISLGNCPVRGEFTKLLRTGRYVGCVHIRGQEDKEYNLRDGHLTEKMGVAILLYSRGKHATLGFLPTMMQDFVNKLLEVIPNHGSEDDETSKDLTQTNGEELGQDINNISQIELVDASCDPAEQNGEAMDVGVSSSAAVQNYWDYQLDASFRPTIPLSCTQNLEDAKQPRRAERKRLNFFKGCKWAPDGSCLMSNSDDDHIRIFNVSETLYGISDWNETVETERPSDLSCALSVKEGGQLYDYAWYPLMSSYDPVSCCFVTTAADAPVHLWDAFTGKLRASYLVYNHLDQVIAARSVAFDPTGQKIYCGFDTMYRIFDITKPGRKCFERKLKHSQISELSQPGIVSAIAVNPALQSVTAIGSYLKTIGLYHDDGSVLCILQGHLGGVTHLKFSNDGTKLFSGGRMDSRLICWDLRQMGEHYQIYDRVVTTNQRIYFDITPNGKYLVSGGTDGKVLIWDLCQEDVNPLACFQANSDCTNGISINPFIPILATSSGQRHLRLTTFSDDDTDEDEDEPKMKQKNEADIRLWKLT